ncbi:MAG: hypothetical protein WCA09_14925 [Burkholderiales bacterium]
MSRDPAAAPQQIAYAATDAWACRELYVRFKQADLIGNIGT